MGNCEQKVTLFLNGEKVQNWLKKGVIVYDHPDFYPGNTAWQFGSGIFKGWIDNFKIVDVKMAKSAPVSIKLRTDRDMNFFTQKEPKNIQVGIENFRNRKINGTLKYQVLDFQEKKVFEGERKMVLKPHQNNPLVLNIPLQKRGCFWLRCDFEEGGENLVSREINYAVGAIRDVNDHPDSSPFGIQISHRKGATIPDAGLKWVRIIMTRRYLEPKKGIYYWERMDEILARYARNGRKVMGCLFGMPPWVVKKKIRQSPLARRKGAAAICRYYPPADWKKHEEFLRKLITRYRDQVDAWEVWNEANAGYWCGTYKEYMKLLKITHRLIRELDPTALIVGPSICNTGYDNWSCKILGLGAAQYLDVFAGHYFGGGYAREPNPECVPNESKETRDMLNSYGGSKLRIWDGESGYLTATRHGPNFRPLTAKQLKRRQNIGELFLNWHLVPSKQHAQASDTEMKVSLATVKRMVLCLANGIGKTFVHPVGSWCYEADLKVGNKSKGTGVLLPTIAWTTMVENLVNADFVRRIDLKNKHLQGYLFKDRRNQRNIVVLWATDGRFALALNPNADKIEYLDIWGNPIPFKGTNPKRLNLVVSESPCYLIGIGNDIKILPKIMSLEFPAMLTQNKDSVAIIRIDNPSTEELRGEIVIQKPFGVTLSPRSFEVKLNPGGRLAKQFTITPRSRAKPGTVILEVFFNAQNNTYDDLQSFPACIIKAPLILVQTDAIITVDGDPGDSAWVNAPVQNIDSEKQVVIGRPLSADPTTWRVDKEWSGPKDLSAKAKIRFKDKSLYVLVQVKDNVLTVNRRDQYAYQGDCVEIFVDARPMNEQYKSDYSASTHQLLFSPGDNKHPKASWQWLGRDDRAMSKWKVKVASQKTADGYVMEMKIPLDQKHFPSLDLKKGGIIGFDIAIDDADGAKKRKTQMSWRGSKDNYYDASQLGKLKINVKKR